MEEEEDNNFFINELHSGYELAESNLLAPLNELIID